MNAAPRGGACVLHSDHRLHIYMIYAILSRMSTHLSDYTKELRARYDDEQRSRLDAEMHSFDLAGQLLSLRREAGMTQQQLAERSGISQADISHYERGLGNPTQKTIAAIAAVFGAHLALVRDGEPVGNAH
jgi:DNA-binding XRE family transcriptional regulator